MDVCIVHSQVTNEGEEWPDGRVIKPRISMRALLETQGPKYDYYSSCLRNSVYPDYFMAACQQQWYLCQATALDRAAAAKLIKVKAPVSARVRVELLPR